MSKPRKAWVEIQYDGKNITKQVSASLLSFMFADKTSGEADELEITLHDRYGYWISDWYPKLRIKGSEGSGTSGEDESEDDDFDNW